MSAALERLAAAVQDASGIRVGADRLPSLRSALQRAAPEMTDTAVLDALASPERLRGLTEQVIEELTVQETFFMREPGPLQAIDWRAMLARARTEGRGTVRVWSAACASGEEPYTLAMLATEALGTSPPVSVLATDISRSTLALARRGLYRGRSLRNLDVAFQGRYLQRADGGFAVTGSLRELVRFQRHSLARDPAPPSGESPFDLVVCRNVLIYLDGDAVGRVVTSLREALLPGGTLLLGSADRLCVPREPGAGPGEPTRQRPPARPLRPGRARRRRPAAPRTPEAPEQPRRADLRDALRDADAGRLEAAIAGADRVIGADPLNAAAYFVRATAELASGASGAAVHSLRSALYVEPHFGLAAFKLGRAYEALGDRGSARRAYERALRTLDADQAAPVGLADAVEVSEVAAACALRVRALAGDSARG